MGDVVLGELLKTRGLLPSAPAALDYWVAYEDTGGLIDAMKTAATLRQQGASVEYALKPAPLGKQLDSARKAAARTAVILRADGSRVRKDLASGAEEPFTFPNG
jgi:histidyl-tRNA synthetase